MLYTNLQLVRKRRPGHIAGLHPVISLILMFIGLPAIILLTVALSTTVITLPFAFLFGWF